MSHSQDISSLKRKRPDSNPLTQSLADADRVVLNVIKNKKDMGIWTRDIKRETNLPENIFNKSLKALLAKKLIKEVVNIQNKGRKHYMAAEFEPSKEVTGGSWYVDGSLDKEFISVLKASCLRFIRSRKVATTEQVYEFFKKSGAIKVECTVQQILEILRCMVLDNEIIEVKSTGLGEYHSIPVGSICYRCATAAGLGQGPKVGALASIPCGVCPRINQCTPDGIISPSTCAYFTKWLDIL